MHGPPPHSKNLTLNAINPGPANHLGRGAKVKGETTAPSFLFSDGRGLLDGFHGLARRKNKFPAPGVMVMLLVPLAVGMAKPRPTHPAGAARLLFCCNV